MPVESQKEKRIPISQKGREGPVGFSRVCGCVGVWKGARFPGGIGKYLNPGGATPKGNKDTWIPESKKEAECRVSPPPSHSPPPPQELSGISLH